MWHAINIDARTVEGTDPQLYRSIIDKHGADSDVAKVEVYGQFPSSNTDSFILRAAVEAAVAREVEPDNGAALIMGVDVARFGSDSTVIRFRRGRDARSIPPVKIRNADNMAVVKIIAREIDFHQPDAVCIDASATGVIDRLRELRYVVHAVDFGGKAEDDTYANIRTEIWARVRDWLPDGAIDDDHDLVEDLATPSYKYQANSDRLMLERKDEIRKRGFRSPDDGDALALTFAVRVPRRDMRGVHGRRRARIADGVGDDIGQTFSAPPPRDLPRYYPGNPIAERGFAENMRGRGRLPRIATGTDD
jgi:hypothetical protein